MIRLTAETSVLMDCTSNGATVPNSYTYDGLGNLLSSTESGKDDWTTVTTSLNYAVDTGYTKDGRYGNRQFDL